MLKTAHKRALIFLGFFGFILLVTFLAYARKIPRAIVAIPYYDAIGHFVLFGMLGWLAHLALGRRTLRLSRWQLPIGPLAVAAYATADECLQKVSPNRTFDIGDLAFGILGLIFFVTLDGFMQQKRRP